MEFLTGADLSRAIRKIAGGKDVRCAVAFWGDQAAKELRLATKGKDRAKIICDLSMGGTNPGELEALGAPRNGHVRYRDGLHAKVYLSSRGAVIGSANASDRGVGFQAAGAQLLEAGVLIEFDPRPGSTWSSASEWFDAEWGKARQVDRPALTRAQERWEKRQSAALRSGAQSGRSGSHQSLLNLVRSNPGLFAEIGFVFASTRSPREDKQQRFDRDAPDLATRNAGSLEQFTDWGADFVRWPEYFFEIWKPKERIYLFWRRRRAVLPLQKPDTLYAEPLAWREIGLIGPLLLSNAAILREDQRDLRRIFRNSPSRLFANGAELARALGDKN